MKLSKNKKPLIIMVLVALIGWAGYQVTEQDVSKVVDAFVTEEEAPAPAATTDLEVKEDFNNAALITPARRVHILYGDATGGGHKYGTGAPCKSEFPKHWGDDEIIKEVELIAANDNLNWEQQRNGYYVTEQKVGTIKVRVVKDPDNKQVITAYPTNTPRNPCPGNKAANDN